jgi:MFS family permease
MIVSLGGMAGGQLLLNIASPSGFKLFVLVSLMISMAVIPILLSAAHAPQFDSLEKVSIRQLYKVSPLGSVGMLISGMLMGAIMGMGAVYATDIGMSVQKVSIFMGTLILGGFVFQYPLGWLSDSIGRRKVILISSAFGALISFFIIGYTGEDWMFFALLAIVGGLTMPLYALCGVHTNDYLTPTQMVAASGTLVLLSAIGATIGSPITAFAMDVFGPKAFYGSISAMLGCITLFALWRLTQRADVDAEDRGNFVVMASSPLSASLNPDVELNEIEAAAEEDSEIIQSSFEDLAYDLQSPDKDN